MNVLIYGITAKPSRNTRRLLLTHCFGGHSEVTLSPASPPPPFISTVLFQPLCQKPPENLSASSVFRNVSVTTVMRCHGRQQCSLHLRVSTDIQLTGLCLATVFVAQISVLPPKHSCLNLGKEFNLLRGGTHVQELHNHRRVLCSDNCRGEIPVTLYCFFLDVWARMTNCYYLKPCHCFPTRCSHWHWYCFL